MSTDVAGLVERLDAAANHPNNQHGPHEFLADAASTIRALVEENERLREENADWEQAADVEARERKRAHAKLREAVEVLEQALKCTPSVIVPSDGGPEIVYDCGDPWELLRAFLATMEKQEDSTSE